MKVVNVFKSLFLLSVITCSFLFVSCDSFLSGSELKENLDESLKYASSSEVIVNVQPAVANNGATYPSGPTKQKLGYSFQISFESTDKLYFYQWVVEDAKGNDASSSVEISDIHDSKASVTVKKNGNFTIKAVSKNRPVIESSVPSNLQTVAKSQPLVINFATAVNPDCFRFSEEDLHNEVYDDTLKDSDEKIYAYVRNGVKYFKNIKIVFADGTSAAKYYQYPVLNQTKTKLVIKPYTDNLLPAYTDIYLSISNGVKNEDGITMHDDDGYTTINYAVNNECNLLAPEISSICLKRTELDEKSFTEDFSADNVADSKFYYFITAEDLDSSISTLSIDEYYYSDFDGHVYNTKTGSSSVNFEDASSGVNAKADGIYTIKGLENGIYKLVFKALDSTDSASAGKVYYVSKYTEINCEPVISNEYPETSEMDEVYQNNIAGGNQAALEKVYAFLNKRLSILYIDYKPAVVGIINNDKYTTDIFVSEIKCSNDSKTISISLDSLVKVSDGRYRFNLPSECYSDKQTDISVTFSDNFEHQKIVDVILPAKATYNDLYIRNNTTELKCGNYKLTGVRPVSSYTTYNSEESVLTYEHVFQTQFIKDASWISNYLTLTYKKDSKEYNKYSNFDISKKSYIFADNWADYYGNITSISGNIADNVSSLMKYNSFAKINYAGKNSNFYVQSDFKMNMETSNASWNTLPPAYTIKFYPGEVNSNKYRVVYEHPSTGSSTPPLETIFSWTYNNTKYEVRGNDFYLPADFLNKVSSISSAMIKEISYANVANTKIATSRNALDFTGMNPFAQDVTAPYFEDLVNDNFKKDINNIRYSLTAPKDDGAGFYVNSNHIEFQYYIIPENQCPFNLDKITEKDLAAYPCHKGKINSLDNKLFIPVNNLEKNTDYIVIAKIEDNAKNKTHYEYALCTSKSSGDTSSSSTFVSCNTSGTGQAFNNYFFGYLGKVNGFSSFTNNPSVEHASGTNAFTVSQDQDSDKTAALKLANYSYFAGTTAKNWTCNQGSENEMTKSDNNYSKTVNVTAGTNYIYRFVVKDDDNVSAPVYEWYNKNTYTYKDFTDGYFGTTVDVNKATFVHILYSEKDYGSDIHKWERNGLELSPVMVSSKVTFTGENVPSGYYYVIAGYFSDGTSAISKVRYKE